MALRDRLSAPPAAKFVCKFGDFLSKLDPEDRESFENAIATVGTDGGWTLKGIARAIHAEYPMLAASPEAVDDAIRRHRGHGEACNGAR